MLKGTCLCGRAGWTLEGDIDSVTACNCTLCRRYGALWVYGYEGVRANLFGETQTYTRSSKPYPALELHFCAECGGMTGYRSLSLEADGRRKIAVNVRLAPPESVLDKNVEHFDGLDTFEDLPSNGQIVRDLWS